MISIIPSCLGSDSESEDESDSEDWSSSGDESGSEGGLDDSVCPVGCDETLFDQTLELREKRLDIEETLVDEKKTAETLRRECEGLKKKLKVIGVMSYWSHLQHPWLCSGLLGMANLSIH